MVVQFCHRAMGSEGDDSEYTRYGLTALSEEAAKAESEVPFEPFAWLPWCPAVCLSESEDADSCLVETDAGCR